MRTLLIVSVCLGLLVGPGCKVNSPGGAAAPVTGQAVNHLEELSKVPASAQLVVTFDLASVWTSAIDLNFGLAPVKRDPAKVRSALAKASMKVFGFDLMTADVVTAWVVQVPDNTPQVAVHFGGVRGQLKGEPIATHEGVRLVQLKNGVGAMLKSGVVLGSRDAVQSAVSVAKGKADSLADTQGAVHKTALTGAGPSMLTATFTTAGVEKHMPQMLQGLTGASLAVSPLGTAKIELIGNDVVLDRVMSTYVMALSRAKGELEALYAEVLEAADARLVLVTYALEKWDDFSALTKPERAADRITMKYELGPLGGLALPAAASMLSITMESFEKYQRRTKTQEARVNIDRIYDSAAIFFSTPRSGKDGTKLPCAFPKSNALTPPIEGGVHPCCAAGGKCKANVKAWETQTWSALNFAIEDDHLFAYGFQSAGEGVDARFTVTAHADLDCDGVFSTFERYGFGSPPEDGGDSCTMVGSTAYFIEKETE